MVLVNSNPATIMTDPEMADVTYIEPITPEIVAKIIEKERHVIPGGFALLPTMGGQTALNCALSLRKQGTLAKFDVETIGAVGGHLSLALGHQRVHRFRRAASQLYEHWQEQPQVLRQFARHYRTGEPLPDDLLKRFLAARKFNQGFAGASLSLSLLPAYADRRPVCFRPSCTSWPLRQSRSVSGRGFDKAKRSDSATAIKSSVRTVRS